MLNPMKDLVLLSLHEYHTIQLDLSRDLTPDYLCRQRGLDIGLLFAGRSFVDETLGYAIVHRSVLKDTAWLYSLGQGLDARFPFYENWTATVRRQPALPHLVPDVGVLPWYVDATRGWPAGRGNGVCVAVLDSGMHPDIERLPRHSDHSDFCSCLGEGYDTADLDHHGTQCAGAIGAKDANGRRTSPAPDCHIVAARVQRADSFNHITLVDTLLMLSWAIHRWNARVVSLSFSLETDQTGDQDHLDLLGRVVQKLRRDNRALVFAAAVEENSLLSYPACVDGFIAVGTFNRTDLGDNADVGDKREIWRRKQDLLFGPNGGVVTVSVNKAGDTYGAASAACAYTAGIAALYIEAHWSEEPQPGRLDMQGVLDLMKQRALGDQRIGIQDTDVWPIANLYPDLPFPRRSPN